jgi:predicted MFS family arabinose efflux permease
LVLVENGKAGDLTRVSRYRWVVLFASFLGFVAFAFSFQLGPPILTSLENEFGVVGAQTGLFMSLVVVPGIFLALPAGFVINKYGFRWLGLLSLVAVVAGDLLTALATDFTIALAGRFILGVGGAFLVVGTPTFIPQWFEHKNLGKAMGIYGTNMPVSIIGAFPVAATLSQYYGWRYSFYVGALVAFVCALFFAFAVREGPLKGEPKPIRMEEVKHAIKTVEVWKVGVVWMLFNTATIAFLSWAPRLFQQFKSLDSIQASLLATVVMYSAVCLVPVFGWASDRLGRRKPFIIAGSILMTLTLISIAVSSGVPLVASVLGLGVSAAMVPPLIMAVIAQNLPPRLSGTGFSIITLCQNIGITLSAPLGGFLLQSTQSIFYTLGGTSLFALAGAVTALTMKTK